MDLETTDHIDAFTINPSMIEMLVDHRVVIVIPAYNEDRFIGSVVLKTLRYPVSVIVVDDGSNDRTSAIAEAAGAHVIHLEKNRGKGKALNVGFLAARLMDPDVIVTIDGDGQHLVDDLPVVVQPILSGQADIVVGSRYMEHTTKVPVSRVIGHTFFNVITRLTSGVPVTDSQSGYRAFSRKAFSSDVFHSTNFTVESEMQFLAREYELKVIEVPITVRYVEKPKRSVIVQGSMVLNGILHLIGQYRPLMFFGVPGTFVLIVGVLFGIWVVDIYARVKTLAVGYAMISVLMTMIGMLLLSTGIILHSIRALLFDYFPHSGRLK